MMSAFGIIFFIVVAVVLIFYIAFSFKGELDYVQMCKYQEKYEKERKARIHWQRMAENPPKILNVKMIGEFYEKDFTTKG